MRRPILGVLPQQELGLLFGFVKMIIMAKRVAPAEKGVADATADAAVYNVNGRTFDDGDCDAMA